MDHSWTQSHVEPLETRRVRIVNIMIQHFLASSGRRRRPTRVWNAGSYFQTLGSVRNNNHGPALGEPGWDCHTYPTTPEVR